MLVVWNLQTFLIAGELSGRRLVSYIPVAMLGGFLIAVIESTWPGHVNWFSGMTSIILWSTVGANFIVAGVAAMVLVHRKLASSAQLGIGAVGWSVCVVLLAASFSVVFPITGDFLFFLPCAMVLTPFTRFLLAPLTYEWNRHR
jgi:hypothetical protein